MLTGSGVTLDALVREAAKAGWDQHVVCGVPADDGNPRVGDLDASRVHPLTFASAVGAGDGVLPFPVPGMSDVMPYPSTIWLDASAALGSEPEPIVTFCEPVVITSPAADPSAVLAVPVVFATSAYLPVAVLLLPVVL